MSTLSTLIPLYWAVSAIGLLLFLMVVLMLTILRRGSEMDGLDLRIAELTDENKNLRLKLDHARAAIGKASMASNFGKKGF